MKKVYLVLTNTYSNISKTISTITKEKYAHSSISLDKKCNEMYSFGRKFKYFPFYGVFKKEDLNKGLFKNKKAIISIYEIEVTNKKYDNIVKKINRIKETNKGYNIIGLFLAYYRIKIHRNKYYCSEFVYEVLSSKGVNIYKKDHIRFKPMELIQDNFKKIYEGKISDFIAS